MSIVISPADQAFNATVNQAVNHTSLRVVKRFDSTLTIYVPAKTGLVDNIARMFSHASGGCTMSEATGGWINPRGILCEEKVYLINVLYNTEQYEAVSRAIASAILQMCSTGEEEVLVVQDEQSKIYAMNEEIREWDLRLPQV